MARKKGRSLSAAAAAAAAAAAPSDQPSDDGPPPAPGATAPAAQHDPSAQAREKSAKPSNQVSVASFSSASSASSSSAASSASSSASSLIICRNKHWRHISSFHGAWLQMPTEILETIANINYNTLRPRPIDAAVLFDLLKIRKNVDEAADLAVRAASDTASSTLSAVNGGLPGVSSMNAFGLGLTGNHGTRLSRERRFRMRELASQKLARAYRLDEIACSVATMQGASTLEEVGSLVLRRSPKDPDAKYVHFFHEKIPSRQLAETTSVQPLEDIKLARGGHAEVLRTLATVKVFKNDLEGAVQDLTDAISLSRFRGDSHRPAVASLQPQQALGHRRRPPDVILSEDEQPSGLDSQLLFQRGCVYLSLASQHVPDGIPAPSTPRAEPDGCAEMAQECAHDERDVNRQAEARKLVKSTAKRALRDLMAFLSQFDYTPDLPVKLNKEFNERVFLASQGVRNPRCPDTNGPAEPHTVYPLSDLFSAVPPADLPAYPTQDTVEHSTSSPRPVSSCEWVTYHPLLTEALHSLLLCHCLAQTSAKELQRHAYMVARLVRLCDGYPVFQASRSPTRTDWIEVLRRTKNWLDLCSSWETLCFPAPLPAYDVCPQDDAEKASAAAALVHAGCSPEAPGQEPRKAARIEQAAAEAGPPEAKRSPDDDAAALCTALAAKTWSTDRDAKPLSGAAGAAGDALAPAPAKTDPAGWLAREDAREYPLASDRSACIARWVLEAPAVTGTRRKRRVRKANAGRAADGLAKLDLRDAEDD